MQNSQSQSSKTFTFPDIPWQPYPIQSISKSGRKYNLKSIIYPTPTSRKKFTRNKQLVKRSLQAKFFDSFINIGYFDPLIVVREFPVVILNSLRLPGLDNGFFLLDYFIPNLKNDRYWGLNIELDSDLHSPDKDRIRDEYLNNLGVFIFRISHLEKPETQKKRFKELVKIMNTMTRTDAPRVFSFSSL
jgi:hypothetical protein